MVRWKQFRRARAARKATGGLSIDSDGTLHASTLSHAGSFRLGVVRKDFIRDIEMPLIVDLAESLMGIHHMGTAVASCIMYRHNSALHALHGQN